MRTGNNNATNNFVVRIWSPRHYRMQNYPKAIRVLHGTITDAKSKETRHFNTTGQFIRAIELLHMKADKSRPRNKMVKQNGK